MNTPAVLNQPHSTEAERTLLGALLLDSDRMIDVRPVLKPDDFFDPVHRAIYIAMTCLYDGRHPIDFVTVHDALQHNPQVQQIGGPVFLAKLVEEVPTASHAQSYAEIIREKSLRRQLTSLADRLSVIAREDTEKATDILEAAERQFLQLAQTAVEKQPVSLADMRSERFDRYTALYESDDASAMIGTRTGFAELDELLTAMAPGHLLVLAGRPSMGKTALALDIARHVGLEQGKTVAIFSLEMTKEEVFDRVFGSLTGIQPWKLTKGLLSEEQFMQMGPSFDRLDGNRIFVDDASDRSMVSVRSKARRLQMQQPLDLVVIDYLQLIQAPSSPNDNQTTRMSLISQGIKELARELQCPILALSQLNRECERRPDKRPQLSDLRDSGSIEQDADRVLMLYREGYYNEDTEDPQLTELFVRKNRHGPVGQVQLQFNERRMTFEETSTRTADSRLQASR